MTVFLADADVTLYHGDVLDVLRELEAESVDCVVTSPPYWGLRDYGTSAWEGGDAECDHTRKKFEGDRAERAAKASTLGGKPRANQGNVLQAEAGYGQTCGKCGARRVDQQIGLEPTPDLFVQSLVAVFREVRRVLASHGTCWVNLGDSYAGTPHWAGGPRSSAKGENRPSKTGWELGTRRRVGVSERDGSSEPKDDGLGSRETANRRVESRLSRSETLKPKDLCGIPWRVAFALQQPYYAGRIKDERDRIWLAAMVDAEGCIHIHRRKAGTSAHSTFEKADGTVSEYVRKQDTYGVMVTIDNTSQAIIDRCHSIVGQGSRYEDPANSGVQQRKQTLYRWTVTGNQARELLRELYPHLVAKQREARIAYSSEKNGDKAAQAHEAIKDLHNGRPTDWDAKPPETLYEPGWYLRSDVIWGKPNPMPESVTDRPTKSHEYVFLLTKQPRYFFDQEAVREPHTREWWSESWRVASREKGLAKGWNGDRGDGGAGAISHTESGRNIRSVWTVATQPYPEAHFATYPEELVRRCVLAGCPVRVCRVCGKPSERIVDVSYEHVNNTAPRQHSSYVASQGRVANKIATTTGWSDCGHNTWRPGRVLDPFVGSGTSCKVARDHGRHSVGIDLNAAYLELAAKRLQQQSLFSEASA